MAFVAHAPLPLRQALRREATSRPAPIQGARVSARLTVPGVATLTAAVAAAALAALPVDAALLNLAAERPKTLGVRVERYLDSCPRGLQNCISSQEDVYGKYYVPSWTYNNPLPAEARKAKTMAEAVNDLLAVLDKYEGEGVKIVTNRATKSDLGAGVYVYAEFKTKLLGFVDDVEFLFNPDGSTVEYRSASRVGKSDLDANRKRIKQIRVGLMGVDNRWASTGY